MTRKPDEGESPENGGTVEQSAEDEKRRGLFNPRRRSVLKALGTGAVVGGGFGTLGTVTATDVTIPKTDSAPTIDGDVDAVWSTVTPNELTNVVRGSVGSEDEFSAEWRALWDESNLYYLVEVTDDALVDDSSDYWEDDSVEIFVDGDGDGDSSYDGNDVQLIFRYDGDADDYQLGDNSASISNVSVGRTETADGYRVEVAVPWSELGVTPSANDAIGTDVHVNNDDDGGDRDAKLAWMDTEDDAWDDPSVLGTAELTDGDATVPSPVHHYPFDGSSATDAAGSADGTTHGGITTGVSGQDGDAWSFDGSDDWVELPSAVSDSIGGSSQSFTWTAWINPSDNHGIILAANTASQGNRLLWYLNQGHLSLHDGGFNDANTSISTGTWYHVAVTLDGSTGEVSYYVDGQSDGSFTTSRTVNTDDLMQIGQEYDGSDLSDFFSGTIDDVRIYDQALTAGEIQALYDSYSDDGGDGTAPTAPSNLSSPDHDSDSVDLDWDAASDSGGSGLDHYNVYVDGSEDHEVTAGTTSTTVDDLSADTSYDFHVTAVDGAGNESASSGTVTVTSDSESTEDATIPKTSSAPTIDGDVDAAWSSATAYDLENVVRGSIDSEDEFSAEWQALWDESNLYYLVEVTDDDLSADSEDYWEDDSVEIFVDADGDGDSSYDGDDVQLIFRYDGDADDYQLGDNSASISNVSVGRTETADGYRVEVAVPWAELGVSTADGDVIGTDVHVNNDDDGGDRDAKLAWMDTEDDAWEDPSVLGTAELLQGDGDTTAPSAPSNLSSPDHDSDSVDLDWDASTSSDVDHYNVYVDGSKDHDVVDGTTSTTVDGLAADTSYDFHVTAVDGAGNESDPSSTITVTTDQATTGADAWIEHASSAPSINGDVDSVWSNASTYDVDTVVDGSIDDDADLSAEWRALWDDQALYVLVEVTDDELVTDDEDFWNNDSVEIFLDGDASGDGEYDGRNDLQLAFEYDAGEAVAGVNSKSVENVDFATTSTSDGWRLEAEIPWVDVGTGPADGKFTGVDVHVNDDDSGEDAAKLSWYDAADDAWEDPSVFGTAEYAAGHADDVSAPSAPDSLSETDTSVTSASVSWDGATDDDSGVSYYNVYVDGSKEQETNATDDTIEDLSEDTSYDVHVTAVDHAGNESDPSDTLTVTTGSSGDPGDLPALGMNTSFINYWNESYHLAEVSARGNGWLSFDPDSGNWEDDRSIPTDENGYPTDLESDQAARALVFLANSEEYETGEYLLTWDGEGTIELDTDGNHTVVSEGSDDVKDYRRVVDITATNSNGPLIEIHDTDPNDTGNNIRNIGFWRPGYWESDQGDRESIFHDAALNNFAPFEPVRYMNWASTNHSPQEDWSDRTTLEGAFWGDDYGAPWEVMIDFSNELGNDAWICVPHRATDDYVQNLAELVYDRLDSNLRVWIEYSNEIWNPGFDQNSYVYDKDGTDGLNWQEWHGRRAKEIFQTFEAEFGGTDRLVRVVSGQAANSWHLDQVLTGADGHADAGAIAYYFTRQDTADWLDDNLGASMDQIFDHIYDDIDYARDEWWQPNKDVCDDHGVPLIGYEGQQHLLAEDSHDNTDALYDRLVEVNRDDRMYDAYQHALDVWTNDVGAETPVAYSCAREWSSSGFWGHKEVGTVSMDDERATKYRAVYDWVQDQNS